MTLLLACCLLGLESPPPAPPSRPCPADASAVEARARESRANAEYAAGNYMQAGELYNESAGAYQECDKYHLRRMTAIERSSRAYEQAHDTALQAGDDAGANAALTRGILVVIRYLDALDHTYPGEADRTQGYRALYTRLLELRTRRAPMPAPEAPASADLSPAPSPANLDFEPAPAEPVNETLAVEAPAPLPPVAPRPSPVRQTRSWRGLAAGGAISLLAGAGMLAVVAVYSARNREIQREYNDIDNQCHAGATEGPCAGYLRDGRAANILVATGLVAGPLLAGTGAALIVLAVRRRHAPLPLRAHLGPTAAGLIWEGRF